MSDKMVDITLHIKEDITRDARENLRTQLLNTSGVMSVDYRSEQPHLMVIEYDPDIINSVEFNQIASMEGLHTQLIGF